MGGAAGHGADDIRNAACEACSPHIAGGRWSRWCNWWGQLEGIFCRFFMFFLLSRCIWMISDFHDLREKWCYCRWLGMLEHMCSYVPILCSEVSPLICLVWMMLGFEQEFDFGFGFVAAGSGNCHWALRASGRGKRSSTRGWFWICQWRRQC